MFLSHLGSIVEGWVNWGWHNCSLVRKPFIALSIHGCRLRPHHITINLWQDILYHAVYWNATPLNWWNCWKIVLRLLQIERNLESSSAVTLVLHTDWMMLKNASNQGGANSVTVLSARNPSRGCWSLRKLHFSKIIWQLALGFSMDLRLNTTRRSINLSVCLVFDLEAGRFKFLGEICLALECLKMSFPHLSPSYNQPTKFPRSSKQVFKEYSNHF